MGQPGNPLFQDKENHPGKVTQFSADNQPLNNGRPAGVRNRSTIARKVLDMLIRVPDEKYEELLLSFPEMAQTITVEEYITMQQTVIATKETNAYKAIMDSAYGAPKQEIEQSGSLAIQWNETKTYASDDKADTGD